MRGESLEDNNPENRPESSLLSLVVYRQGKMECTYIPQNNFKRFYLEHLTIDYAQKSQQIKLEDISNKKEHGAKGNTF